MSCDDRLRRSRPPSPSSQSSGEVRSSGPMTSPVRAPRRCWLPFLSCLRYWEDVLAACMELKQGVRSHSPAWEENGRTSRFPMFFFCGPGSMLNAGSVTVLSLFHGFFMRTSKAWSLRPCVRARDWTLTSKSTLVHWHFCQLFGNYRVFQSIHSNGPIAASSQMF